MACRSLTGVDVLPLNLVHPPLVHILSDVYMNDQLGVICFALDPVFLVHLVRLIYTTGDDQCGEVIVL